MNIVKHITSNNLVEAKQEIDDLLFEMAQQKLVEVRKMISVSDWVIEEGRFKIVRAKVRNGKILRRHKEAAMDGFTMRGGKVTKMSPTERRKRRLSQRKGARKRKAKRVQTRVNTKKALRKRRSMGI